MPPPPAMTVARLRSFMTNTLLRNCAGTFTGLYVVGGAATATLTYRLLQEKYMVDAPSRTTAALITGVFWPYWYPVVDAARRNDGESVTDTVRRTTLAAATTGLMEPEQHGFVVDTGFYWSARTGAPIPAVSAPSTTTGLHPANDWQYGHDVEGASLAASRAAHATPKR